MDLQDNQPEIISNQPEHLKQPVQQENNSLANTEGQTASLDHPKTKHKIARLFVIIPLVILGLIVLATFRDIVSTQIEHHKLSSELRSLDFSSSKPQVIGYENEPTDSAALFSSTFPGMMANLSIKQTTLGNEVDSIKNTLQNRQFTIEYSNNTPDVISGTSNTYSITIGIEYNGSPLPLEKTSQKSAFNGEPISIEPGANTIVNSLYINLEGS